jgi:hypothetical protein
MQLDKKRSNNTLRFTLLRDIGAIARDADGWTIAVRDIDAIVHALRTTGAA